MLPDDKRHGTNAGYLAHRKNGEQPCEPCRTVRRRLNKRWNLNRNRNTPAIVTLGTWGHKALLIHNPGETARLTGLGVRHVKRLIEKGPTGKVRRETKAAIMALRIEGTTIGMTRRMQALAAIGYSSARLEQETGITRDALKTIRNREPQYVHDTTRTALTAAYERLSTQPLPPSRSSTRARNTAAANHWPSPMAWDNIDDPDERPNLGKVSSSHESVDDVVVDRRLEGIKERNLTKAETQEVIRRARLRGINTDALRIKADRYKETA